MFELSNDRTQLVSGGLDLSQGAYLFTMTMVALGDGLMTASLTALGVPTQQFKVSHVLVPCVKVLSTAAGMQLGNILFKGPEDSQEPSKA